MKYTVWILVLASCMISCSNGSSQLVVESIAEASVQRVNDTGFAALVADEGGICRAYAVPADLELKGCTVKGPMQGELFVSRFKGPEVSLKQALQECINNVNCTGVSSSWYVGAKWGAFAAPSSFTIDESSYGCPFLVGCP